MHLFHKSRMAAGILFLSALFLPNLSLSSYAASEIQVVLELYPGVAGSPPLDEAKKRLERKVEELRRLGCDVPRSALIAAAHVSGIKKVELIKPEADIPVERHQAAHCTRIEVGSQVADEP